MKNNMHYSTCSSSIQLTCWKTAYTDILDLPSDIEYLFTCLEYLLDSLARIKLSASFWSKDPLSPSSSIHYFVQCSNSTGPGAA